MSTLSCTQLVTVIFAAALLTVALACQQSHAPAAQSAAPAAMTATPSAPAGGAAAAAVKPPENEGQLLAVGAKAPDFTLPDSQGAPVTLSSFQGKKNVVLVFYPGDETPGCTRQLCAVRDDWADFQRAGVAVFGVNPQKAESHRQFIENQKYQFELLVDADKKVCTAYGTKGVLMTTRTVYGIDKTGTIVFAERGMPANQKILAAFEKK